MVVLYHSTDATAVQHTPNTTYPMAKHLALTGPGTQQRMGYLYFSKPFPAGATILSATLRLYTATTMAGSVTLSVQRINTSWSVNRLTWNNKPAVAGTIATLVKSNAPLNSEWAVDVKSIIQAAADGAYWGGLRLSVDGAAIKYWFSSTAVQPYRPTLEIVWSEAPQAPRVLSPDGNRAVSVAKPTLRFDFQDLSGNTQMASAQVQLNPTDAWVTPLYDTGEIQTSVPQIDLNAPLVSARTVTTNSNTTVNGPAGTFSASDVGATIVGSGIPGGTTITGFTNDTTVTISAAATASATITATITKTHGGFSDTASTFWRVRVRDGAGLWSSWSAPAQFQRQTHGTLVLNNPAASPNNFVFESTPPIDWSFTVRTQKHYQVILSLASNTGTWLWDSGKITSSATVVTIPADKLKDTGATYNIRVRVWDTISREATPTDTAYVEVSRDFTFSNDPSVGGVTSLVGTLQTPYPWILLTWNRSSMPDFWEITRDNKPIAHLPGVDMFVSGTSYQYMDRLADPRVQHTWRVYAVVNGKRDNTGASVVNTTRVDSTMLARIDGTEPVLILNPSVTPELRQLSEVHELLGNTPPVLITQALRGYEGSITGVIADDTLTGRTARQMRDTLKSWRNQQGIELLLYLVDEAFEVVAFNINYKSVAYSGNKVKYAVSFDFFQTDF